MLLRSSFVIFIFFLCPNVLSQWELRYPDFPSDYISDMVFLNENKGFFVNTGGSILISTDSGNSWEIANHFQRNIFSKIKFLDDKTGYAISPHSVIGDTIHFVVTNDGGLNWSPLYINMSVAIDFLPLSYTEFLKSNEVSNAWLDFAIERYNTSSGNWQPVYDIPKYWNGCLLAAYGDIIQFQNLSDKIIALGSSHSAKNAGIISDSVSFFLQSLDNGFTWDTLWCGLPFIPHTFHFTNDRVGWLGLEYNKLYKTTDGGISWVEKYSEQFSDNHIQSIHTLDANHIYAVTQNGKVIYSNDGGENWQISHVGDQYPSISKIFFLDENNGFIAGNDLWKTTNGGASWFRKRTSLRGKFWKIDFADENNGMAIGEHIYKTTDGGYSWIISKEGNSQFSGIDILDSLNVWVVGYGSIYKTNDGGNSWSVFKVDDKIQYIRGIKFLDHNIGVLYEVTETLNDTTYNYVTTDGGLSWKKYPITNQQFISSYFKLKFTDNSNLWFVNQQGVWLSRDTAKTWELNPIMFGTLYSAFDFVDSLYGWFALSDGQQKTMKFTTDGGNIWTTVNKPFSNQSMDLLILGKDHNNKFVILVAGFDGALFKFYEGSSLGFVETTFTQKPLFSIASFQAGNRFHVWVAGEGMTLLHTTFLITDINDDLVKEDFSYHLVQNFPNPFNPTTTITYQIKEKGFTTLKIYDLLGKEVTTLVNEEKIAGKYEVKFDATSLSSGIYFYRLEAGSFIETKKMILIR